MRVLIAGAIGGLGSLAARALADDDGCEVRGVGRARPDRWPDDVAFQVAGPVGRDTLTEFAPETLLVFGDRGRRPCADLESILQATGNALVRLVHWGDPGLYARNAGPVVREGAADDERARAAGTEGIARAFAREHRALEGCWFRCAEVVGSQYGGIVRALAGMPLVPRLAADPPLQLVHEKDAIDLIRKAVRAGSGGTYNVAADGILRSSELGRAVGRAPLSVPLPLGLVLAALMWLVGRGPRPGRWLRWARGAPVLDNGRLKTHFGFRPRYDVRKAVQAALS